MLDVCKLKVKGNSIIDNGSVFKILDDINIDIDSVVCYKHEEGVVVYSIYVENVDIRSRCTLTITKVKDNEYKFKVDKEESFNHEDYEFCLTYSDYYYFIKDILKVIEKL